MHDVVLWQGARALVTDQKEELVNQMRGMKNSSYQKCEFYFVSQSQIHHLLINIYNY